MEDVLDKFLKKYSYKFDKGYPDLKDPKDVLLLESLLKDMGIDLKEKSKIEEKFEQNNELEKIIKIIDKEEGNKITKTQLFDLLADYTYKSYSDELGEIKEVFPNPLNTIEDWEKYIEKKESNNGKEVEQVIINYSKEQGVHSSSIRGKGVDILIGEKEIEIKSSGNSKIVTLLQTSFYKNDANKFYAFVSNTLTKNITVRIISSQLLYRLSLGDDIVDELSTKGTSDKLIKQIKDGLNTLDFLHFIQTSITTGKSADMGKSFIIGKNIRIRFKIYIEPK